MIKEKILKIITMVFIVTMLAILVSGYGPVDTPFNNVDHGWVYNLSNVTEITTNIINLSVGGKITIGDTKGVCWSDGTDCSSGATDHGALTGLSDDDHTQYLLRTPDWVGNNNSLKFHVRDNNVSQDAWWDANNVTIETELDTKLATADYVTNNATQDLWWDTNNVTIETELDTKIQQDGTIALTANWDAGSYEIRAQTFESDVTTGTAPFTVASTTKVTNLQCDSVDGVEGADMLVRDGSVALTSNWLADKNITVDTLKFEHGSSIGVDGESNRLKLNATGFNMTGNLSINQFGTVEEWMDNDTSFFLRKGGVDAFIIHD